MQEEQEYLPTPEEIRQQCERIQAGWTPKERRRRLRTTLKALRTMGEPVVREILGVDENR